MSLHGLRQTPAQPSRLSSYALRRHRTAMASSSRDHPVNHHEWPAWASRWSHSSLHGCRCRALSNSPTASDSAYLTLDCLHKSCSMQLHTLGTTDVCLFDANNTNRLRFTSQVGLASSRCTHETVVLTHTHSSTHINGESRKFQILFQISVAALLHVANTLACNLQTDSPPEPDSCALADAR
jgi:hypothetical protein